MDFYFVVCALNCFVGFDFDFAVDDVAFALNCAVVGSGFDGDVAVVVLLILILLSMLILLMVFLFSCIESFC